MDEETKKIEESFDSIPEEVKDYIYSKKFVDLFTKFLAGEQLSVIDCDQLKGSLYGFLAQENSEDDLIKTIHEVSKTADSSQRIIDWIKTNVTDKVLDLVVDAYVENEEDEEESSEETTGSEKTFINIEDRLSKPSTVAPITRDYSVTRSTETPNSEPAPRAPSMDIYREIPEK